MRWILMLFALVIGFVAIVVFAAARGAVQEAVAGTLMVTAAVLFAGAAIVDAVVRNGQRAAEAEQRALELMESLDRRLRDALQPPAEGK